MINHERNVSRHAHKLACMAALALSVFLVADTPAGAAEVDRTLAAAAEAYAEGDYRRAAARLNELSRDLSHLALEQKLNFWDVSANLAEASGVYVKAEKAARTHLELLQGARVAAGDRSGAERNALVRLARIKRTLAGEKPQEDSSPQSWSSLLHQAVDLLRDALQNADDPPRPLWEAEARLELARTFERLGNLQDATQQYARSASLADRALSESRLADDTVPQLERAVTIIRQAAPGGDELALQRQATAALRRIEGLLTSQTISPAVRGKLLAARADCVRQLNDVTKERQILERLTAQDGDRSIVWPS